jgi:uncharacterized protein YmfQ (DUF2313 family)
MGGIKKLLARVFNTCECCGKKLKPEDMKYKLLMETWIDNPNRTSGYDCTVCHECVSTLKIYEMVSRINVIRKLKKEE